LALGFYKISPIRCAIFILIGKACRFAVYMIIFKYTVKWLGLADIQFW